MIDPFGRKHIARLKDALREAEAKFDELIVCVECGEPRRRRWTRCVIYG